MSSSNGAHDRRAEVVTLREVAAVVREPVGDRRALDTLGDAGHLQVMGEIDDGAHDGGGARVLEDRHDELLVEFDLVDGQFPQILQPAESAPEIVDRHANSALA